MTAQSKFWLGYGLLGILVAYLCGQFVVTFDATLAGYYRYENEQIAQEQDQIERDYSNITYDFCQDADKNGWHFCEDKNTQVSSIDQ